MSDVEAASRPRLMEARSKNHSASRLRKASASFSHCAFQKEGLRLPLKRRRNLRKQSIARPHATQNLLSSLPPSPACRCPPAPRICSNERQPRTNRESPRRAALARSARRQPERTSASTHDRRQRRLLRVQQAGAAPCDLAELKLPRMFCSLLVRFGALARPEELVPPAFCTFRH